MFEEGAPPFPSFSLAAGSARGFGGWAKCTVAFCLGHFRWGVRDEGVSAAVRRSHRTLAAKATRQTHEWKRGRGLCASGWPSPVPPYAGCALFYRGVGDDGKTRTHEARRRWGKDSFLPPNRVPPEHPSRKGGECEEKRHTKYLGASSPSENARGRMAEGASPFGTERTRGREMNETTILLLSLSSLLLSSVFKRSARLPPRRPFHSKKDSARKTNQA